MKCVRCGYCCTQYVVIIVDDPAKGVVEGNLIPKPGGVPCQHLQGDKKGDFSCGIHEEPWYPETPCFDFTQIEADDSVCRMGEYQLERVVTKS